MKDAEFWKAELWRETSRLRAAIEREGLDYYVARPAYVERYAFVTAYEVRKLAYAEALTPDITEHSCDLLVYQAINPPADVEGFLLRKEGRGFRVALEHHYDLESPRVAKFRSDSATASSITSPSTFADTPQATTWNSQSPTRSRGARSSGSRSRPTSRSCWRRTTTRSDG